MDIDACLAEIKALTAQVESGTVHEDIEDELRELLQAAREWRNSGGFMPAGANQITQAGWRALDEATRL